MASAITCPRCQKSAIRGGFPIWVILCCIVLFPVGLLTLLVGRKPNHCHHCGNIFT